MATGYAGSASLVQFFSTRLSSLLLLFVVRSSASCGRLCFSFLSSVVPYLPVRLGAGEAAGFGAGHYRFPFQPSRILLCPAYFFTGVGIGVVSVKAGILAENGEIAK